MVQHVAPPDQGVLRRTGRSADESDLPAVLQCESSASVPDESPATCSPVASIRKMLMNEDDDDYEDDDIRYHHLQAGIEERKDSYEEEDPKLAFLLSYCDPIEEALLPGTGGENVRPQAIRGSPALMDDTVSPPHMLNFAACGYCLPDCRRNNDSDFRKTTKRVRFAMDYIHPDPLQPQHFETALATTNSAIPVPLPRGSDGIWTTGEGGGCLAIGSGNVDPAASLLVDEYPLSCLGSEAGLAIDQHADTLSTIAVAATSPKASETIHEKSSRRPTSNRIARWLLLWRGPWKNPSAPAESPTSSTLSWKQEHAPERRRKRSAGKCDMPQWIQRNQLGLLLVLVGIALIVAVTVPLANHRKPLPGGAAANATSYNEKDLNGTWSEEAGGDSHSGATSSSQKQCFSTTEELQAAVDTYLSFAYNSSSQEQASFFRNQMKAVAGRYGWPMNNWCTSNLTSLTSVFSARRNPLSSRFNEDVGRWDVGRVQDFSRTFEGCKRFTRDLSKWRVGEGLEASQGGRRMQSSLVLRLDAMFLNASSYNQSLCTWGRRLWFLSHPVEEGDDRNDDTDMPAEWEGPTALTVSAERMFRGTDCPYRQDPSFNSGPPPFLCGSCGGSEKRGVRLRA